MAALRVCEQLEKRGQILQAIPTLNKLTASGDGSVRESALLLLAKAYVTAGKLEEAARLYEDLLESAPWHRQARFALADLHRSRGMIDKALLAFDELLERGPHDLLSVRAARIVGDIRFERKEYSIAIMAYRFALRVAGTLYEGDLQGLDISELRGKLALAGQMLRAATAKQDELLFERAEGLRARCRYESARDTYQELAERYPDSPYAPQGVLHIGDCWAGEKQPEKALRHWGEFVRGDRTGPWRGQALVGMGDLLVEHLFRVSEGIELYREAARLLEELSGGQLPAGWPEAAYSIHQRCGLLAYIRGDHKVALQCLERAAKAPVLPRRRYRVAAGYVPTGIENLMAVVREGRAITPGEVRQGSQRVALVVSLADVYHELEDYEAARRLYGRVVSRELAGASAQQRSWASLQLARVDNWCLKFEPALRGYLSAVDLCAVAPWADRALLLAGVLCFNNLRKPEEALKLYRRIVTQYPRGNEADRAAYYIGLVYQWTDRPEEAKRAYEWFFRTYPNSSYVQGVKDHHVPELLKALANKREGGRE